MYIQFYNLVYKNFPAPSRNIRNRRDNNGSGIDKEVKTKGQRERKLPNNRDDTGIQGLSPK